VRNLAIRHTGRTVRANRCRLGVLAVLAFACIAGVGAAHGAPKTPVPVAPAGGAVVDGLPAFAWKAVARAEEYEFQIAADAGFNSPVLGRGKDNFRTKNLRATLQQTVPNGTYWWRVRAISRTGFPSAWSRGRSFRKNWARTTELLSPLANAVVTYPGTSLRLRWSPVEGARTYLVSVATDPRLGSLVRLGGSAGPAETTATNLTPAVTLPQGTYYWGVTPVDAQGNRGAPSRVASFTWFWPSTTTPNVTDLASAPELFDPRFSWTPVAGAARYEVEINSSVDFAVGSKVCCTGTTINASLSPTAVFRDNRYYWRVRAIDIDGDVGVWNIGPSFTKTFDKVAPAGPVTGTSIKNVRLRDNLADPGTDIDGGTTGFQTRVPVVRWDPVPGAASYEIQVAAWTGVACSWATADYIKKTSVTEWTPLASTNSNPVVWQGTLAKDTPPLTPGTYCLRVRARSDRAAGNQEVWGDYTYVQNGIVDSTGPVGPAFTWTDYPDPSDPGNSTPCAFGYPCAGDYLGPVTGTTTGRTPLFRWKALAGANSYFVVVAKDANFSNIVDEAFTRIPAYAPRPRTYTDETTTFYWAVLPASAPDGSDALPLDLPSSAKGSFQKQSTPPAKLTPTPGQVFLDKPTFQWAPVLGARTYRLQIAHDPSFGALLDDVTTASTAYSSDTTYPADTVLYWRVRANDENNIGLAWSSTGTFQKRLATPVGDPLNPIVGDFIPNWSWSVVPGAVSYDLSADLPDGTHRDLRGFRGRSMTPTLMYGTGIFHWRVRAQFPRAIYGTTPGPYSPTYTFTRTIREPGGARAEFARDWILLRWNAKPGARGYRVEISGTPDFERPVERVVTDNTAYAPSLEYRGRRDLDTGRLYWRVAALDEGNNEGDYTRPQLITRIRRMEVSVKGTLRRGRSSRVMISVSNFETAAGVSRARIRISGAGVRRRTTTTRFGWTRLALRPTRRGYLVISASRRGYQGASIRLRIR
jgi:hypothetical protein